MGQPTNEQSYFIVDVPKELKIPYVNRKIEKGTKIKILKIENFEEPTAIFKVVSTPHLGAASEEYANNHDVYGMSLKNLYNYL